MQCTGDTASAEVNRLHRIGKGGGSVGCRATPSRLILRAGGAAGG